MEKSNAKGVKNSVPRFTKEQLVTSVKYSRYKDVLSSQLRDDILYTHEETDKIINVFLKERVK